MKYDNIHIIGISEGEEKEEGMENLSDNVMTENFNSFREKFMQVQEAQVTRWTQRGLLQNISQLKQQTSKTKRESQRQQGKNRR